MGSGLTRDDIIRLAREADIIDFRDTDDDPHVKQMIDMLQAVVERAVAQEREACAVLAESQWSTEAEKLYGEVLATAIRARKPCLNGEPLANQEKTSGSPIKEKDS